MAEKTGLEIAKETQRDDENNLTETGDEAVNDATDETGQIREQIEETRNRLGDTIDAIQEKLSFSNISEQVTEQVTEQVSNIYETAKESVYEATIVKAGKFMSKFNRELQRSDIINKIGENPLPLFLITVGTGLLFFNGKKKNNHNNRYRHNRSANRNVDRADRESANKSFIGGAKETLTGAASSAYETAGNAANTAYESVTGAASGTMKKFNDLGGQARDKYDHYIEENPLAIGAVAFAVGAVVGLAIPATEYENEIAGEARENLISKVKDSVNETVDKVKNIAGEAKNVIGEEAKNQGLV